MEISKRKKYVLFIAKNNWKEKKTQCVRFGTASRMIQATLNKSV